MANISKIKIPGDNTEYTIKDNSQSRSDHMHYGSDMVPLVHKKYESTSYYATAANQAESTWYFMSVKPDSWYKPWRVKFKVHSYCPNYSTYQSYTWATFTGRSDAIGFCNWNERQDSAHYYLSYVTLKKAGFDAGYGNAIGVSILYAGGYTNSAYYRSFEIDYYECENCTVTILDTPVKLANWTGYNSTNYNGVNNTDAVNRGLQETGDADSNNAFHIRNYYTRPITGTNGFKQYGLFAREPNGKYTSFTTNHGTGTKTFSNTTVYDFSMIYYFNSSSNINPDTQVTSNSVIYTQFNAVDMRYSFNGVTTSDSTSSLIKNKPLYLVVSHNWELTDPYYTQVPTASTTVYYIRLGDMFSCYQLDLWQYNPIYEYDGTYFKLITNADAITVNGHTVDKDVPSNAVFTDSKVTQSPNDSTANNFEVLFSTSADNTSKTEAAQKSSKMTFNPSAGTLTTRGLEVKGVIAGDSGSTGHGLYGGGGYHNAYNNILLHGDASTGTSGIAFVSDKSDNGTITNVNQPSDRGFIQYHACGITTASAEGTNPTLATSGENGRLVIGIGNDATDQLWLQTPGRTGLIHQVAATSYVIPDTGNTSGSVGSATKPIYVEGGIIKAGSYTLGAACEKAVDTTVTSGSANLITSGAVYSAIDALPEPMIFKGSVGTGGTITTLPAAAAANEGFTYKVITAMTTPVTAKVGDTVISNGTEWVVIPSGDEPSGTVTSVGITNGGGLTISGSPVTDFGSITVGHSNSVTAQTTQKVYPIKIDAYGHISAYGTSPTTLSGYGITDAKIASGTITLGSNTITPLTSASTLDATKLSGTIPTSCYTDTKNTAGSTDTSSKIFLIGATSQAANPQTYSDNEVYVTSGVLQTKNTQASAIIAANTANSSTQGGLSLYGTSPSDYGIAFRGTGNGGKHGYVQGDWAQYHYMAGADNRGWIFNAGASTGVASISKLGNAVFNGSVTVGGNATNTSGCKMEYNTTTQSLDFIFA